jgi:hypothetical protein
VYRSADLWRTLLLVVALLPTAVSTGVFAREFRAADPQDARHSAVRVLCGAGWPAAERSGLSHRTGAIDLNRTNVALIGTMAPVLIGRLRKMERN